MNDCDAILLAAGKSKRLGFDKIMTPLGGRPVLMYSLEALARAKSVRRIILATRRDLIEPLKKMVQHEDKPVEVIEGGVERQDSVWNGLQKVQADYVLIHDAARPLINAEMIEALMAKAREKGSAVCAQKATDTIKRAESDGKVRETLDRSEIWLMKTPQVFEKKLIVGAYRHVQENKIPITDDAAAVEASGKDVFLADVGSFNLKITRADDWKLMTLWLQQERIASLRKCAHEISNQANPMVGYLPLLEKHGGSSPQFLDYLSKIKISAAKLQETLRKLQSDIHLLSPEEKEDGDSVSTSPA